MVPSQVDWARCTGCGMSLPPNTTRCPECGGDKGPEPSQARRYATSEARKLAALLGIESPTHEIIITEHLMCAWYDGQGWGIDKMSRLIWEIT